MNTLTFHTNKELTRSDLLEFGRTVLKVSQMQWSDDSIDTIPDNTGPMTAYVLTYPYAGQFPFQYEIYIANAAEPITARREVDLLILLARQFQLEALTPNEDIDPYSYVHILPDGNAIEVDIDTEADRRDELSIAGYYPLPIGGFATDTILSETEISALREWLGPELDEFEFVTYRVEEMNNDFTRARANVESLKNYHHHYVIKPVGKNRWRSQDEKSELLTRTMSLFYNQTNKKICVFPPIGTRYANIPGGSDRESFCIVIDSNGIEKIVYKELRKSWN